MQPHLTAERQSGIQALLLWSAYGMNEAYVFITSVTINAQIIDTEPRK